LCTGLHRLATEYVPSEAQVYEQSPTPTLPTKYQQRFILVKSLHRITMNSQFDLVWDDFLLDHLQDRDSSFEAVNPNEIHQNLPKVKVEPAEAEEVTSTKDNDILENAMDAAEIPVHALQPKVLIQAPPPQQPPKVLIVQPGKRVLRKKKMTDTVNEEEEAVQTPRKKFKSSGRPVMYNLPPQKDDEMDKKRRDAMNARMNRERKKKEFEALTQTVKMRTAENDKLWSFLEVKGLTDEAIGYMNNH